MDSSQPTGPPPTSPPGDSSPPFSSGPSGGLEVPDTLCHDGYRAEVVAGHGTRGIAVKLMVSGVEHERLWAFSDYDTTETRAALDRLLPLVTALCRFYNTDTGDYDVGAMACDAIRALNALPGWTRRGLTYLASRSGGTDVVFAIPGRDRALRVVEDQFAEVLDPNELQEWLEERRAEEAEDDFSSGEFDEGDESHG